MKIIFKLDPFRRLKVFVGQVNPRFPYLEPCKLHPALQRYVGSLLYFPKVELESLFLSSVRHFVICGENMILSYSKLLIGYLPLTQHLL